MMTSKHALRRKKSIEKSCKFYRKVFLRYFPSYGLEERSNLAGKNKNKRYRPNFTRNDDTYFKGNAKTSEFCSASYPKVGLIILSLFISLLYYISLLY